MTQESQGLDPYEVVLADLRAQRDRIDQAIVSIESVRSMNAPRATVSTPLSGDTSEPGDFLGMTIPDAAKKLLSARRRAMGNAEIAAALNEGGLAMNSVDPVNTIGSVLARRFHATGDIVRVSRGTWGLAEWYPNRNFRKKQTKDTDIPTATINGQAVSFGPVVEPNTFSAPADPDPWSAIDGPVGRSEMEQ